MQNYETGDQYPCPSCKQLDCNGCNKVPEEKKKATDPFVVNEVAKLLAKAEQVRAGHGEPLVSVKSDTPTNEGSTPSQSTEEIEERVRAELKKQTRDYFRAMGSKGGEIGGPKGGAKTKEIYGREHFVRIGRLGGRGNKK